MKQIKLLDCTLRDGAYINDGKFGEQVIKGLLKKLQNADIDIIECGWLKDSEYQLGSAYYHVPEDARQYLIDYKESSDYVAMIDWDRYDTTKLPVCDHRSINAIRVVFPRGKAKEGIAVAKKVREKGYNVYLQAANTLGYSDEELMELVKYVNEFKPVALSVVDTFGAMLYDDLKHIVQILNDNLDDEIQLGFHSHNNQQMSFALTANFIDILSNCKRGIIVDSSLSGMGRGAGNATTELVASYLNRKYHGNYDMNSILDAIDTYIDAFREKFTWGYSTSYFIAGMYQCHVNNIAYLRNNHRTNARDMQNIISSLSEEERRHYDYDLLESKYMENQNRQIDDNKTKEQLKEILRNKKVLLVAPGKSILTDKNAVKNFINDEHPIVIGVNAISTEYEHDYNYLLFVNSIRYSYAKDAYDTAFQKIRRIISSNIHTKSEDNEFVVNFNSVIKRGWPHFDNAVICALRLLVRLEVRDVYLAGFDGFKNYYNESYADEALPTLNPNNEWDALNDEIKEMFLDVKKSTSDKMNISFVTKSIFDI